VVCTCLLYAEKLFGSAMKFVFVHISNVRVRFHGPMVSCHFAAFFLSLMRYRLLGSGSAWEETCMTYGILKRN
jgi:hypothetical protein